MLIMFSLTNRLLVVVFLVFCCATQFKAQTQNSLTIEQAKNKLEQLQSEYTGVDKTFNEKVETEVSKQVSTAPKGEFESTQQYNARQTKAETQRRKLQAQYAVDRKRQQDEIRKQIGIILDLEFTKPVTINLETYDADEENLALTIIDKTDQTHYKDFLYISRDEARLLKESFSDSQNQGLFGVALEDGQPKEYYYGFRINLKGKQYTNLPSEMTLTLKELAQYSGVYTEPLVIHIRKTLNAYLKNPGSPKEVEFTILDRVDSDYFQSKFIVLSIEPFIVGGKYIKILFQDRPDKIFAVWVYSRIVEMRSFEAEENDARTMRLLRIRYKKFLQDKVRSL